MTARRLPLPFDRIQCADLAGWTGDAEHAGWRKVVASVADLVGRGAPSRCQPPPQRAARRLSICVLPFANMSGDPEQEYFSDGISEDIITDLSKVSALSVVARNTAFTFKGKSVNVPEVARELGVSHVLEGSVRKAGGRVRITAQLIDGAAGDHVWAERYDRDLTDIFALQDEISQAIVAALKLKLLPEEKQAIERRGTGSVEAYDLYLMARQYWLTGNQGDARAYEAIIRLCGRAVEIDPSYAQAWTLMASAQSALSSLLRASGRRRTGGARTRPGPGPRSGRSPCDPSGLLSDEGRQDEAAAEIAIALRLDPESYEVNYRAGAISYRERRLEDAVRYSREGDRDGGDELHLAVCVVQLLPALGDGENARRAAQTALARAERAVAQDPQQRPCHGLRRRRARRRLGKPNGPRLGWTAPC